MDHTPKIDTTGSVPSFVTFQVDNHTFALPLVVVVQILPMMTITPIPHISKVVKGTINVRGQSVVVANLRVHFGMTEETPHLYTPMLLVNVNGRKLALIVDEMKEVQIIPPEKIDNLETMLPEGIPNIPMVRGVFHGDDETILILDPDKLFFLPEQIHAEQMADAGPVFDLILASKPDPEAGTTPSAESSAVAGIIE